MSEYKISLETLNAVLAYLGNRPYQEVFGLIKAIQDEASKQTVALDGDKKDVEPEELPEED